MVVLVDETKATIEMSRKLLEKEDIDLSAEEREAIKVAYLKTIEKNIEE